MEDNQQLNTPGEILASARKKAGLSLAELATRTKIQQDMLQAIERDEYHKISGDLYVKSFMGSFAREVGIEPEIVVNMYRDFSGEAPESNPGAKANQWDEEAVEVSSVGLPWMKILVTVAVLVCVGGAIFYFVMPSTDQSAGGLEDSSTIPTTIPEENQASPVVESVVDPVASPTVSQPTTKTDTLSLGWQTSLPVEGEDASVENTPMAQTVPSSTTAGDSASRILATSGRGHLPTAFPGDQHVEFKGKRFWPVVLRLVCDHSVDLKIKRDGERNFSSVVWPANNASGDPLPARDLAQGTAYAVRRGLAVYWGAGDHFSLVLPDNETIEISVNGVARDLSRVKPGQEIILDAPSSPAGQ